MKKLFAVIFAWTLFSTQAFAQTAVENEKVAQLRKMIDSHLADLEETDIEEVQAFFAGNNLTPVKLEEAISKLENMNLSDARELAASLGIEEQELDKMTEEEWQQHKGELALMLNQAGSDQDSYTSWTQETKDYCFDETTFTRKTLCIMAAVGILAVSLVVVLQTLYIFLTAIGHGVMSWVIFFGSILAAELGVIIALIYQAFKKRKCRPDECHSPKNGDSANEPAAWFDESLYPLPPH